MRSLVSLFCTAAFLFMIASPTSGQTGPAPGVATPRTTTAFPSGLGGGGVNADFDSLIDLIISTIATESWAENGGGEAEIRPYVSGVYADAAGVLRRYQVRQTGSLSSDLAAAVDLADVRRGATAASADDAADDPRRASPLRYVSLRRLEAKLATSQAERAPIRSEVLTLAGLRRVRYVLLLPPTNDEPGDLLLAGPAGDWRAVGDGRIVSADTGESVVRLDDLLTLLRRAERGSKGPMGCSIDPRPEALAAAQAFLSSSKDKAVPPSRRAAWSERLREKLGLQDIRIFGIDPTSRAAGVLVEADHHMKLIGMGLEEGVPGVDGYLETLVKERRRAPASTGVLRWWFSMHYTAINATPEGDAYELAGPGARVMSEKELLDTQGGRAAAAQNDEVAEAFAGSFSRHFADLCRKYPIYSELRNVFDLAIACEIARDAREKTTNAWRPDFLLNEQSLPLPTYTPARVVETVVNHRELNRRTFVTGVSGGVWSDPRSVLASRRQIKARSAYDAFGNRPAAPSDLGRWWWDAE
ncbi:MAG: DUF1598 domain-containing protein [Planctomycetota bacterium]